jgi:hypothetical protein
MLETLSLYVAVTAGVGVLSLCSVLLLDARAGNDRRRHTSFALPPLCDSASVAAEEDWIHSALVDAYGVESEAWAEERTARVQARLQDHRPSERQLFVEILWIPEITAFTTDGQYIYLSRRLLERCATDEPVAFVLAHEMAHHDLGHVQLFRGWRAKLPRNIGGELLAAGVRLLERRLYSPEQELAADARALDLCAAAGYNLERCIAVFDVFEAHLLDHGDLDGVYGPDLEHEEEWMRSIKQWLHHRERGYPSVHERRAALIARAREISRMSAVLA